MKEHVIWSERLTCVMNSMFQINQLDTTQINTNISKETMISLFINTEFVSFSLVCPNCVCLRPLYSFHHKIYGPVH